MKRSVQADGPRGVVRTRVKKKPHCALVTDMHQDVVRRLWRPGVLWMWEPVQEVSAPPEYCLCGFVLQDKGGEEGREGGKGELESDSGSEGKPLAVTDLSLESEDCMDCLLPTALDAAAAAFRERWLWIELSEPNCWDSLSRVSRVSRGVVHRDSRELLEPRRSRVRGCCRLRTPHRSRGCWKIHLGSDVRMEDGEGGSTLKLLLESFSR